MTPLDVHVWHRATADALDAGEIDLSVLSSDERVRCARFVFARDRRDFAGAHALLRTRLSACADVAPSAWAFDARPGGKPFIPSGSACPPLAFNVSHTDGLVACAIAADGEVGIDVESVDRALDDRKIAARYFSAAECASLDACGALERPTRFIELWTLKEAYIKAIGRGLSHPLNSFGFTFEGAGGIRFRPPPGAEAPAWTFALYAPSGRYRMAVAAQTRPSAGVSILARSDEGTVAEPIRGSIP